MDCGEATATNLSSIGLWGGDGTESIVARQWLAAPVPVLRLISVSTKKYILGCNNDHRRCGPCEDWRASKSVATTTTTTTSTALIVLCGRTWPATPTSIVPNLWYKSPSGQASISAAWDAPRAAVQPAAVRVSGSELKTAPTCGEERQPPRGQANAVSLAAEEAAEANRERRCLRQGHTGHRRHRRPLPGGVSPCRCCRQFRAGRRF